jgi:membrane protease YdiL (CAAX protease family)
VEHPFQRWVDLARPCAQLLRTAIGSVLVVVAWLAWTMASGLVAIGGGLVNPDALGAAMGQGGASLTHLDAVMAMGVLLATFWGLWLGVWLVAKLLHKRDLSTVLAHDRRIRLDYFLVGMALAAGYLALSLGSIWLSGPLPARSSLPIEHWLIAFAPLVVLIFFQTAGEELFFRGYLTQQLAARIPHPLVWGLLPSLAFGLAHTANGGGDAQFTVYYVAVATLLGLVMTALVWRTGGLAAAMGFHLMNNIGAMLLVGIAGVTPPIALFVMDFGTIMGSASTDVLVLGLLLAFVLSPFAPLPRGQPLRRK